MTRRGCEGPMPCGDPGRWPGVGARKEALWCRQVLLSPWPGAPWTGVGRKGSEHGGTEAQSEAARRPCCSAHWCRGAGLVPGGKGVAALPRAERSMTTGSC